VKGILADINIQGNIEFLVMLMAGEPWKEFWEHLQIPFLKFADVGLPPGASDRVVWNLCQAQEMILITGNRNARGPDSLQETIRQQNTETSLPVLTLADPQHVFHSRAYADQVIDRLLDFLGRIESLRGTARLYLP
jgi:hypothetical protein